MGLFIKVFFVLTGLTLWAAAYVRSEDMDDILYDTVCMFSDSIVLLFGLSVLIQICETF